MYQLPAPSSGLFLEISFRRLLDKCESMLGHADTIATGIDDPRSSPVFHHHIEVLQEQLTDLLNGPVNRVDEALLAAYRERVHALAQQLKAPQVPAFCLAPVQQTEAMASLQEALQRAASGSMFQRRTSAAPPAADASGHANDQPATRETDATSGRAVLTQSTQARLQTHLNLQETLTDELVGLARHLKRNAQAFEGALQARETLLDDADANMTSSVANAKQIAAGAKTVHRKNRVNFCTTCLVLMMVGLVFAGMYMFIKVTSFVGYKRARQVASDYARQALKRRKTSHATTSRISPTEL